jgi:superfamily II DNA or RNA helicase
MKLRLRQKEASDAVFKQWETVGSTLVVMPTGVGKTRVAVEVASRILPKRTMFVAHIGELLTQCANTIKRATLLTHEVEKAELRADCTLFRSDVVLAMIQSLNSKFGDFKRMGRFKPQEFGCLIYDECHRSVAPMYRNLTNYMRTHNPEIRIMGLTATPDRLDKSSLGQLFDSVAYKMEINEAIDEGWLVPVDQHVVYVNGLDFSAVRTTAGDLNGPELAKVMEIESNMQGIAGASIPIIGSKRTLVFCTSVKQAETLSDIYNRHHPGCSAWVCGKHSDEVRKEMLDKFASGQVQIMCNCNCLSEGYDNAAIEVVIMGHPTKSRARYAQWLGRGTRPLPGLVDSFETAEERKAAIAASTKPCVLALDFAGNSGKHKLITAVDILGGKLTEDQVKRVKAMALGKSVRISDAAAEADRLAKEEAEAKRQAEAQRKAKLVAKVKYTTKQVDPFGVFGMEPNLRRVAFPGRGLTPKQREVLMKQGINPDSMPYHQAKQLLDEVFRRFAGNLCSFAQAKVLKKYGYPTGVTRQQASKTIDSIAKNGWKKSVNNTQPNTQPKANNEQNTSDGYFEAMADRIDREGVPF